MQLWVFVYIKYGKFCSVSLEHFVEHKLFFSEEWQQLSSDPMWKECLDIWTKLNVWGQLYTIYKYIHR